MTRWGVVLKGTGLLGWGWHNQAASTYGWPMLWRTRQQARNEVRRLNDKHYIGMQARWQFWVVKVTIEVIGRAR